MSNNEKRSSKSGKPNRNEERRTMLDEHEEQMFVDDVPLEDLKIEAKDEKRKTKSKDDSQSEKKHKEKQNKDNDSKKP
ncbi:MULTISPECIES: hypothetical protein [Oceanobacillus]|uniref:Uncharacterized protein n=2 Tax=Oceanobacillus TaxID=182709 RepID=A0A0A1MX33_9BACI|nr:hypothetical protein [Oceanobacillus oncorhynchi]MDM8099711.1 hypothetical protein [Oceanobacillus oncorhynchi]UUI41840.1 hypothetical protein NP440_10080 [Oceanobacillus oncorhynchi]CEI83341.1 hypothetical protein BN997_03247 [Oceanobacillus oncorhynchi]